MKKSEVAVIIGIVCVFITIGISVQLRTIAMDFWASLEHKLRYKKNIPADALKQISDELVDCANRSSKLDERMTEIHNHILSLEESN